MSRYEEIAKKANELCNDPANDYKSTEDLCIMMAEWADEYPKQITLSSADRGIIDEIIFALNSLGKEKMISYHKEIEFLNKIRKL